MPYTLGSESFATKKLIEKRCQEIRDNTPDGATVPAEGFNFLIHLFRYHDEWHEKSYPGVSSISTQTTEHGTRGFLLNRTDGSQIDISFPHAIKLIPTTQTSSLTPQRLQDYKAAARTAVQEQVREFRDAALSSAPSCPINNLILERGNCDVHYPPPDTFESLLFRFTQVSGIRPLTVDVDSCGTVATFHDESLSTKWAAYHRMNAKLQLVSKDGRRSLPKSPVDWSPVL
jgi:hypothetical protein|uniref:DUF3223 domain-containing protein n=1 Tax=Prosthecobacter sp. TaxID=1965333 RepID=UPI003782E828